MNLPKVFTFACRSDPKGVEYIMTHKDFDNWVCDIYNGRGLDVGYTTAQIETCLTGGAWYLTRSSRNYEKFIKHKSRLCEITETV